MTPQQRKAVTEEAERLYPKPHNTPNNNDEELRYTFIRGAEYLSGLQGMRWEPILINYDKIPKGDLLLLTTSKMWIVGDWWCNNNSDVWGWRTTWSKWEGESPNMKLTLLPKEDITHYLPLPPTESPSTLPESPANGYTLDSVLRRDFVVLIKANIERRIRENVVIIEEFKTFMESLNDLTLESLEQVILKQYPELNKI